MTRRYWIVHPSTHKGNWRAGPYLMSLAETRNHEIDFFQPVIRRRDVIKSAGHWTRDPQAALQEGKAMLQRMAFAEKRRIEDGHRQYEAESEIVNAGSTIRALVDAMSPVPAPVPRGFRR